MGLAEPRRRIKISQDPNNLSWAQSADSYGQKLLSSQGWKPGEGLGARGAKHFNSNFPAIKITHKDDNLGLGTNLKYVNPGDAQTGLDAFQGLLAKLNSKDESEVNKLEQRSEDRKLALWTQGKWGGVVFVPGGLLVQGDRYSKAEDDGNLPLNPAEIPVKVCDEKAARKAAKALRRTARRARHEAKLKTKAQNKATDSLGAIGDNELVFPTHGDVQNKQKFDERKSDHQNTVVASPCNALSIDEKKRKCKMRKDGNKRQPAAANHTSGSVEKGVMAAIAGQPPPAPSDSQKPPVSTHAIRSSSRSGRHIIRGRNIEAKRMAFADAKTLDEVWRLSSMSETELLIKDRFS